MKNIFWLMLLCVMSVNSQNTDKAKLAVALKQIKQLDSVIALEPTAENYYYRGYMRFTIGDDKNAFPDLNKSGCVKR